MVLAQKTYWADGVRRKAAVQVGWSALHRVFQSTEVENKVLPKEKRETQCQNLSVGDELRLARSQRRGVGGAAAFAGFGVDADGVDVADVSIPPHLVPARFQLLFYIG